MEETKTYTTKYIYNRLVESNKLPVDISYFDFKALIEDLGKLMSVEVLDRSRELKMPHGLGTFTIVKYKPKTYTWKSLSVDFELTKLYGKQIFHLNDHSNGYKYRMFWAKHDTVAYKNKTKYNFKMCRRNKRYLAQLIKLNKQDYQEL